MPDPVYGPGITPEDLWNAWAAAYVELCKRIVDEATDKPGRHGAASVQTLRSLILRLREHGALEPRSSLLILPDARGAPDA